MDNLSSNSGYNQGKVPDGVSNVRVGLLTAAVVLQVILRGEIL